MIKKLLSFIVLFTLISSNIVLANSSKDDDSFKNLLINQTKEQLEVELKLFKLQRNLVNELEWKYTTMYKKIEKNIEDIQKVYTEDYISKTKVDMNISINTNSSSNLIIPNIDTSVSENLFIFDLKSENILSKWKLKDKSDANWNLKMTILDNKINTKFNITQIIEKWRSIFTLNKLFLSSDLNYNEKVQKVYPYIDEIWFDSLADEFSKKIKLINKNSIKLKWKTIEFSDPNIMNQSAYWSILTQSIENFKNKIKEDRINQIFRVLKEEKMFHVYKSNGKNRYSVFYNNELSKKVNILAWKDLLPTFTYAELKKIEHSKENIIEQLKDDSFKYLVLEKDKARKITKVIYFNFTEDRIYTWLVKNEDGIIFLNKNVIQFRNENNRWKITFLDWEIQAKLSATENDKTWELSLYIQEEMKWLVSKLEIKDSDKSILWTWDLMYITNKENDDKRLKFNLNMSGNISDNRIINKEWKLELNWEYLFKENFSGFELFITDTSMFPLDIKWYIKTYLNFKNQEVIIPSIDKIDFRYTNINTFFQELLK